MISQDNWNPDLAGAELAALFAEADRIMQQPHYQVSGEDSQSSTTDSLPTTEQSERKE